jgi:hypothetical protein
MAYSTYAAEPKLYSVETRGISIFNVSPEFDLRVIDLSGIPVRIKIESRFKYIYVKTPAKTLKETKTEFSEKFLPLFQSLMQNFFKDDAYIYGVYKEERFFIYDIYTNNNWFTFYDLTRIEKDYGYQDFGFELLPSLIKEKRFTTLQVLNLFSDIIKENPEKQKKLFIIPYYDLVTATGYGFIPSNILIPNLEAGDTEEKIFGTYVAPATTAPINTKKNTNVKEGEDKELNASSLINLSKDIREKNYQDSKKNITSFILRKKYVLTSEEKTCVIIVSYLWSIWSHLNMRSRIVDYLSQKENYVFMRPLNCEGAKRNYSYLMLGLWFKYNLHNLNRLSDKVRKSLTAEFINKILEEEFSYFDHSFDIILKDALVKIDANAS